MNKKYLLVLFVFFGSCGLAQQEPYENELESLYDKAYQHLYKNKDSASYYFNLILNKAKVKQDWINVFDALISENRNAGYFYDLKTLENNLLELDTLLVTKRDFLNRQVESQFYINSILYDKGNYYYKVNNYRASRENFQKLISNIEELTEAEEDLDQVYLLSASYSFMAKMYQDEGKYQLAKQYYTKDIRYLEANNPTDLDEINKRYSLLASVYSKEQNFQTSNHLYKKVIRQIAKENVGNNSYITACNNIAQNYIFLKERDSASHFLFLMQKNMGKNSPFKARFHSVRSEKFQLEKNYSKALEDLKRVLVIEQQKESNGKNLTIAKTHQKLGELHQNFGDIEKAIDQFSKAIDLVRASSATIDRYTLFELLSLKANAIRTTSYSKTLEITQSGIQVLDSLKPTFKNQADKLFLIENAFPLFEAGIEAAYQLFESKARDSLANQAFEYIEKSKSVLLLEALLGAKATQFANIPNDILERELQIKSEVTYVQKQLNRSQGNNVDLEDQLFELKEEHRGLIKTIETEYKAYYNLKYNTETISLPEVQKLLRTDEKLITYFYGNKAIYALGIEKKSKKIIRITLDSSLEKKIKQMHQLLGDSKSDVGELADISHQLYKKLIAPFHTSKKKKKLILITDGLLKYLPYGALNTSENGLSYLVEEQAISYANSATLYAELIARDVKNGDLLAFAPIFAGEQVQVDPSRDKLLALPHNTNEVEQILTSFNGQSFKNRNATLENFNSELSKYSMLHLATHAILDDTSPDYSYLAFTSTKNEESLLYVSDLYNLQIKADLVTLSACETGVGELKRGEGFLSLARGFFYSGASSIASTLWKINDASTTTLMDSFYKNLADGDTKDLALQKAKNLFLNNNRENGLSHPYYWSGFIISGNTEPIVTNNYMVLLGLAVLLAAVAGFLVFGRKEG